MDDKPDDSPAKAGAKPAPKKRATKSRVLLSEHARNSRLGRELIAHCVFLTLFCVATVLPVDDPNYEGLSWSLRNMMLQEDNLQHNSNVSFTGPRFIDVNTVSDFWKWLRGPFLHVAYMTNWFAGNPWQVGDQGLIAGQNLIVGTISVRQKRVRRATCTIPDQFFGATDLSDCVADFSSGVEDKEAYGPFYTEPEWASAFSYNPNWPGFWGLHRYYAGGGYAIELPASGCLQGATSVPCVTKADRILQDLQMTGWIDYRTRALMVELTVYNAPLNRFALVQAIIEMPSSGGVLPTYNLRVAKLIRYATTEDFAVLGLEIALLLLIFFDIVEKVLFYRNFESKLRDTPWDMYDLLFHTFFLLLIIMRVVSLTKFGDMNYDPTLRMYYNFGDTIYWHDVAEGMAAWCAWMIWFRTFKFLNELSWARLILQTLVKAAAPLIGLCLSGFIMLLAFAHLGLVAFGTQIYDLRTFGVAVSSCFRYIFSGMRYDEFQLAGSFLGPLYYIGFKIWMVLIMVRFFVAVILDAYRDVMEDQRNRWILSFPPLQALAEDLSAWWEDRKGRGRKRPPQRAFGGITDSSGKPHTLSGDTLDQAAAKAKKDEKQMSELDAREMYDVLQGRVTAMQEHMDLRISNIEKIFVTTVAPLVETLDILVKQQTENAALAAVRAVNK